MSVIRWTDDSLFPASRYSLSIFRSHIPFFVFDIPMFFSAFYFLHPIIVSYTMGFC